MNFFANLIAFFIAYLFLIGVSIGEQGFAKAMTLEERRAENERIQAIIKATQQVNQRPSFRDSPRAARTATNRYKNQLAPRMPKTIYQEPIKSWRFSRFAGGIPR